jgi:hypothetical protein
MLESRTLLTTVTVDRLTDNNPTGGGEGGNGMGDLRWCVEESLFRADTINFSVTGTINLARSLPTLTRNVSIQGPAASLVTVACDSNLNDRVFTVATGVIVSISGLTITNSTGVRAGGISNAGTLSISDCVVSGNSAAVGGGISNSGLLTVSNSALSGNSAVNNGGGISNTGTLTVSNSALSGNSTNNTGAGIYNSGSLTMSDCVVAGNSVTFSGWGGGISNSGSLTVINSTFAGNSASVGAGIYNLSGTLTISNSTVSRNSATDAGGGIDLADGSMTSANTIFGANTAAVGSDVYGNLGSRGYNLLTDLLGATGWTDTDVLHVNPMLAALQDNGGTTQTMALLPGSPALNAGDPAQLGVPDQRGVVRAGGVNIGAYQASATGFAVTAPGASVAGAPFDVTVTAVDPYGQGAIGYTGTVTFSSADPYGASLPADYTFGPTDNGTQTFAGGATLYTVGPWDVTATDTSTAMSGSATVTVTPAAAAAFVVGAPDTVVAGTPFDFTVTAVDPYGNTDTNYQGTVVFSTMDPAGTFNPTGYTFQAAGDMGTALFPMGATLNTAGSTWDITATDTAIGITGSAYVTVNGGPAPSPSPGRRNYAAPGADAPDIWAVNSLFAKSGRQWQDTWSWAYQVEALV